MSELLRLPRWLAGAFLLLMAAQPAAATVVINDDPGGYIVDFVSYYKEVAKNGDKVIIRGDCASACTLITALVPAARVCATPLAFLGFHSATRDGPEGKPVYSPEGTAAVWKMYPAKVRAILQANGWDGGEHPSLVVIKATSFFKPCANGEFLNESITSSINQEMPWWGPGRQPGDIGVAGEYSPQTAPKKPTHHTAPPKKPAPKAVPMPPRKQPQAAPAVVPAPNHSWLWEVLKTIGGLVLVGAAVGLIARFVRTALITYRANKQATVATTATQQNQGVPA